MNSNLKEYLQLIQHEDSLTEAQAETVMDILVSGRADSVQTGAVLMGLATRGETVAEIVGMLRSLRRHMTTIDLGESVVDTCGTGGDGQHTFNISTAAALVCAALGVPVAKHGNRAASSRCGSADVLEALSIPIQLKNRAAQKYFQQHHFVFLFAPNFHPAMKQLAPVRQALGVRTIINFLGPLANPAQARHQVIGVSDPTKADVLAKALIELGSKHVVVVYSDDGVDEASCAAASSVLDVTPHITKRFRVEPRELHSLDAIRGGQAIDNAKIMRQLAAGEGSAILIETVAMNAGLALLAADRVDTYEEGKELAEKLLRTQTLSNYLNQLAV